MYELGKFRFEPGAIGEQGQSKSQARRIMWDTGYLLCHLGVHGASVLLQCFYVSFVDLRLAMVSITYHI